MRKAEDFDFLFKIILIGDSGVGKSNLISRFTTGAFQFDSKATIGVEFAHKTLIIDEKTIKLQIWDTGGQERYRAITSAYYRGAYGALLVYDTTKNSSFENVSRWMKELKEYAGRDLIVMLIGNKNDLKQSKSVTTEQAVGYAQRHGLALIEISALAGTGVQLAFERLANDIYQLNVRNAELSGRASTLGVFKKVATEETVRLTERAENRKQQCCQLYPSYLQK